MIHHLITVWFSSVRDWRYLGVFLLMAMESSIVPLPSELVIPPAAYWATQGAMSIPGVILAGTLGSYVGAMVMYFASRALGRPLMLRYGRFILVPPDKLERAERFLLRFEVGGVFFARLLPVVRHLIGIPAGIVRMSVGWYSVMTLVGSGLWCTVLAFFGTSVLGSQPHLMQDPDALGRALREKSLLVAGGVLVLAVLYFAMVWMTRKDDTARAA